MSPIVNDVHSGLTETRVAEVAEVDSLEAVSAALERARKRGRAVSVAGGRHAMGGQPFLTDGLLLDTRPLRRVLDLDSRDGLVEVEAGIQWLELLDRLRRVAGPDPGAWTFAQKQTGADRLTLGGSISANAHGRGLDRPPLSAEVESMVVVDADGAPRRVSRTEDSELFSLVVGGYGLFAVIHSLVLRLVPRQVVRRVVEEIDLEDIPAAAAARLAEGCLYGDFQFSTDERSPRFLRRGISSCYEPVDPSTPLADDRRQLSIEDWSRLVELAHVDNVRAYAAYLEHYLATSGQIYHSDELQLANYVDGYHRRLDARLGARPGTEVITELYVPRDRMVDFMAEAAEELRRLEADVIYGTLRLIRRDDDAFLAWAREDYACAIFNLHVDHTPEGLERAAVTFRRLIDLASARGGSFYLAYHRHATREQIEACYPQFREFLARKLRHDPEERFQSDWYRHLRTLLGGPAPP